MAREAAEEESASTAGRIAAAIALVLVLALAAWLLLGGGSSYTVKARFLNAGQLVKGNLVQASGQPVGTVKDIALMDNGHAEVTLAVDDEVAPLRQGVQANLRTASLSGVANRYVDLQMPAGESQDTIPDGGVIPVQDTTTAVDLDHLFGLFDEKTRKGLRNVIRGFGASYEDRAREANAGWRYLNPSLVGTRRLFAELTYDQRSLERFLVSNSKLMSDLGERRDDLSLLVDRLAVTFSAIGRERTSLTRAIAELAPFMRRANSTFINLRATLDDLDPLVEESIPVTPKLRAVLAELRPFAREATPTFRNLARLVKSPGEVNDLTDLAHATLPFRDVTTRPGTYNGASREGSFAASTRSLRAQTPQWAFQRPYTVDLAGWFDDFSHSGVYDANGSASRVSTTVSAFAFVAGQLVPVPEELRGKVLSEVGSFGQNNRCPGSTERPASDGSNPYRPSADFNCDPSQTPPGK